jgi:hypothetical protein
MKMDAVEFAGLVEMNILNALNERLNRKIKTAPNNGKWDRLPHQALYSFQLEEGIARNPVFQGLLGRIEESIQLYYEAKEYTVREESGAKTEALVLGLQLLVPGRPPLELGKSIHMELVPSLTPKAAYEMARAAIKALLAADPFLKHQHA